MPAAPSQASKSAPFFSSRVPPAPSPFLFLSFSLSLSLYLLSLPPTPHSPTPHGPTAMPASSTWSVRATTKEDNSPTSVPVAQLLGPVLVAVLLNCFVYGIVFLHWIQYTLGRNRDGYKLRALVHWCFFVDTVHSATALWVLWRYSVDHFADHAFATMTLWPVSAIPLFVGAVSAPIQHLFAWRIKQFTHSLWLFSLLSFLSVLTFALGIATAAGGLVRHQVTASHKLIPLVDVWLAVSMTCDMLLAGLLYSHLWRSKTGFRSTDTVIGRLMRSSIETTAASAVFCILYLIIFTVLPKTNLYVIFALPLGRIYSGTLLSTLNSRTTLREELFGVSISDPFGESYNIAQRMRRMPTELAINVEQEVQMERCELEHVDFKQLRRAGAGAGHGHGHGLGGKGGSNGSLGGGSGGRDGHSRKAGSDGELEFAPI
ncbi:hypothetical protein C8Q80DRAFT_1346169 [Daedaleopsis nitida]|nr:hypothetical protein C8Q80DRAFT_1346169 [Daedaleopsis nitida]